MVAVGDDRKPVLVAPLEPKTPDQKRRHGAALVRKQLRQEFNARFEDVRRAAGATPT